MRKAYSSIPISIVPEQSREKPKAYSYLRFSTPEQEEGDSVRRQITVTQAYAKELGLELDKGISAYRGRNAAEGELALFLENVKAGRVPRGSYLMVESLDRISRDEILDAMDVFNGILRQGINLAIVTQRKVFSRASVTANPFELMLAIMGLRHRSRGEPKEVLPHPGELEGEAPEGCHARRDHDPHRPSLAGVQRAGAQVGADLRARGSGEPHLP